MIDRQIYLDAMRRRGRHKRRLEERRTDAASATISLADGGAAPALYGCTTCVHEVDALRRAIETHGGGWLTYFVELESIQLLSTWPFCSGRKVHGRRCSVDHVAAAGQLLNDIRKLLDRYGLRVANLKTGGRWPWDEGLPPTSVA